MMHFNVYLITFSYYKTVSFLHVPYKLLFSNILSLYKDDQDYECILNLQLQLWPDEFTVYLKMNKSIQTFKIKQTIVREMKLQTKIGLFLFLLNSLI